MKARMMARGGTANAEIARIFREVADQLELRRANQFRIRAYRNAARTVEESGRSIASLALSTPKELQELPGVGADLAGKIVQVVRTGSLPMLTTLAARAGRVHKLRGFGAKTEQRILEDLAEPAVTQRRWRRARAAQYAEPLLNTQPLDKLLAMLRARCS